MTGCTCCGEPTDHAETHHRNERKADNQPDNLSTLDRRCHMDHHGNHAAIDDLTRQRYGPNSPATGPP